MFIYTLKFSVNTKQIVIQRVSSMKMFCFFFSLPWNQHTFIGWIATYILSSILGIISFFVLSITVSLFIGISLYFNACFLYFDTLVTEIDEQSAVRKIQGQIIHTMSLFRPTIRFHIYIKE